GGEGGEKRRGGRLRIVTGDGGVVLILGGRSLAVAPAHFVAQVGRCGGDRLHRFHRAQGRHQPGQPAVSVESALEQLRHLQGARRGGWSAQHHGDQPPAVARGGGDEIEAGGADEAGLHAVGAGIAADQGVVVPPHHLSHADAGKVPVIVVFRQFADEGARQDGEVARGGNLVVGGQPV